LSVPCLGCQEKADHAISQLKAGEMLMFQHTCLLWGWLLLHSHVALMTAVASCTLQEPSTQRHLQPAAAGTPVGLLPTGPPAACCIPLHMQQSPSLCARGLHSYMRHVNLSRLITLLAAPHKFVACVDLAGCVLKFPPSLVTLLFFAYTPVMLCWLFCRTSPQLLIGLRRSTL
jgi:hypothetical protein